MKQPQWVPIVFLPYQSAEALRICPRLSDFNPDKEIVVMSDAGQIYQGDGAWITLLWATASYRAWALRMASPALRGLARSIVQAISENRLTLSQLLTMAKGWVAK